MMFVTLRAASIDGTVSDLKEASLGFLYPKTTKISLEFLIFSTLFSLQEDCLPLGGSHTQTPTKFCPTRGTPSPPPLVFLPL